MWRLCNRVMVFLALCLFQLSESQSDIFQFPEKRPSTQRYCGKRLVDTLQIVCNGVYYSSINTSHGNSYSTRTGQKKSSAPDLDDDLWLQMQPAEEQVKFPFRSRSASTIFAHRLFKRHSTGVADECCINKGCSIQELMSYCGQ